MDTLEVLGSASRWKILEALRKGPSDSQTLASVLGISVQGVMKHIRVLLDAGMIERIQIDGKLGYRLRGKVWLRRESSSDYEVVFFFRSYPGATETSEFKMRRHLKRLLKYLSYGQSTTHA